MNQGMILGPDSQKMSKSRGNVVSPEHVISEYGADALRLYEMFMGPLEQTKPWSMTGVEGVYRFLGRVWRLAMEETQEGDWVVSSELAEQPLTSEQLRVAHATIKKNRRGCRGLRLQYRHLADDDFHQRVREKRAASRRGPAHPFADHFALCSASGGGSVGAFGHQVSWL